MNRTPKSPRVAIIGGGIIGCTVACRIREALGFDVDLYERRDDILLETTAATSNRFHYGYQYALSDDTAKTLRDYHGQFKSILGPSVMASANYYGVAADSRVSCRQYLDFCARCSLPVRAAQPANVFTDRVSMSLLSVEHSLDPDVLRYLCRRRIDDCGVNLVFATATPAMLDGYDYVVSAVYGNPNLLVDASRQQDYHFELCEMMTVALPDSFRATSAMIVYGRFMTLDVLQDSGCHVLYCGSHGVHRTNVGRFARVPQAYAPMLYRCVPAAQLGGLSKADLALRAAGVYFRGMHDARHIASTFVIRVQAPADVEDARRRTSIEEIKDGWYRICAAKISACVSVAERMTSLLQRKEAGRIVAVTPARSPALVGGPEP